MISSGRRLAPAILFFGCRSPDVDDLYREQLDEWEALGAVDVRRAYSRAPEKSESCKYVQDRMWKDRDDVAQLWSEGAKVYVCGSRAVADAAKEAFIKIKFDMEKGEDGEMDIESTEKWFLSLRNIRYVTDVFD